MTFAEAIDLFDQSGWNLEARRAIFAELQRLKAIESGMFKPLSPQEKLERDRIDMAMVEGMNNLTALVERKTETIKVPELTTKNIREFIRWVSKGMAMGTITPSAGRGMLYAAQLIQVASPRRRKREPKKPIGFESTSQQKSGDTK